MATTKDWSTVTGAVSTKVFAGGDATNWCVHTLPSWCRTLTVYNTGSGALYVSVPGLSGAATVATDHCVKLSSGAGHTFVLSSGGTTTITTFGTFGADGTSHEMRLVFERAA